MVCECRFCGQSFRWEAKWLQRRDPRGAVQPPHAHGALRRGVPSVAALRLCWCPSRVGASPAGCCCLWLGCCAATPECLRSVRVFRDHDFQVEDLERGVEAIDWDREGGWEQQSDCWSDSADLWQDLRKQRKGFGFFWATRAIKEQSFVWITDEEVHQDSEEGASGNVKMMEGVNVCCAMLSLIFNVFVKMSSCAGTPAYW